MNVTLSPPGAPGARSTAKPSGRSTCRPVAPVGIGRATGSPGLTAAAGALEPPRSSPVRFAIRIGKATWSGRSDSRGSNARTAVGSPARMPAYRSGAPFGPGITVRAQAGRDSFCAVAMWVVERST